LKNALKSLLYLTAMTAAIANIGSAATLANGSVPFTFLSVTVDTPGAYVPHTQFTIGSVMASSNGSGSFDSCPSTDCVAVSSVANITSPFFGDALTGLVLQFGPAGRYTYTVTSQLAPDINHNGLNTADNIFTLGNFHDSVGTFLDGPASLVLSFTESCSGTAPCSESGSATFATPPAALPTPEPAALILTGSALLGLGFIRRKAVK
jgi:hypothetical protein